MRIILFLTVLFFSFQGTTQLPMEDHTRDLAISAWIIPQLHFDLEQPAPAGFFKSSPLAQSNKFDQLRNFEFHRQALLIPDSTFSLDIQLLKLHFDTLGYHYYSTMLPKDSLQLVYVHRFGRNTPCCTPATNHNDWIQLDSNEFLDIRSFDSTFSSFYMNPQRFESEKYIVLKFTDRHIANDVYEYQYEYFFLKPEE